MIFYNYLLEKHKNKFNNNIAFFNSYIQALQFMHSMFTYDINPKIDLWLFELILNMEGFVGMTVKDGVPVYGSLILNGDFNDYGIPKRGTILTYNGTNYDGEIDKDIVICWNNSTHSPDFTTYEYALNQSEVKKSLRTALFQCRMSNMIGAKDDKVKKAIDKALENIDEGKPVSVLCEDLISNELGTEPLQTYSLTHPEQAHTIQYLSKYYDDLNRWFYTLNGQPVQGTGKMAQLTQEEVMGSQTLSTIQPFNKFTERKKFCDKVKEILGIDMKVDFSTPWKISLDIIDSDKTDDMTNDKKDDMTNDTAEEKKSDDKEGSEEE